MLGVTKGEACPAYSPSSIEADKAGLRSQSSALSTLTFTNMQLSPLPDDLLRVSRGVNEAERPDSGLLNRDAWTSAAQTFHFRLYIGGLVQIL